MAAGPLFAASGPRAERGDPLSYRRRFLVAGALLALVEGAAVGLPLVSFFTLDERQRQLARVAIPLAAAVGWLAWWLAVRRWRAPIDAAVRRRKAGAALDAAERARVLDALLVLPRRAAWLRGALSGLCGAAVGLLLVERAGFPPRAAVTAFMVTLLHMTVVQVFRVLAYHRLLDGLREPLLAVDALVWFRHRYFERLIVGAFVTGTLGVAAISAFAYFFLPLTLEHYLLVETYYPLTVAVLALAWHELARRLPHAIDVYLAAATGGPSPPTADDKRTLAAYRAAQSLPYQLAVAKVCFWLVGLCLLVVEAVLLFHVDLENALLLFGLALVATVGVAIYEALWHRATLRPLLAHIAMQHRPPPGAVRTPLSLRNKMLASFGGLTFFACGLSLFLSLVQYKTLATAFIQRESQLLLDRLVSRVAATEARSGRPLEPREIGDILGGTTDGESVVYYLPPDGRARPLGFGGGKAGPPELPWSGEQLMRRLERGHMELSTQHLSGAYERLYDERHRDLGTVAVLLPGYRGRGPSIDPYIAVLIYFFVLLAGASMGIVVLVVSDLTGPIRLLERRAGAMARGDLSLPVIHVSGEADEIGRLTFAFEEMRRALNEKLRSSTEINLSLEQEVRRRTAELERRNAELGATLEALQRAQAELVRSEKLASMGRLVAGIAHEINNPVNAVVNTAQPLEATLAELATRLREGRPLDSAESTEVAGDLQEMVRVIQRGARRTKEIVQALHNYSRGDDARLGDVDLHRGIDESLDLLRHQLKHGIRVERAYGDVGRVRGFAGQLHQVFMNLLTNAAQALVEKIEREGAAAAGGGGTIRIATERRGDEVVIVVSDDGPGIPPDALPHIFDPFFTTKEVGKGSGLGLSIVHGIVERHGGTIRVESEIGRGTRFTVTLPADGPRDIKPGRVGASLLENKP